MIKSMRAFVITGPSQAEVQAEAIELYASSEVDQHSIVAATLPF